MLMMKAKKDLDYWKKKLIGILNKAPMEKSLSDILFPNVMLKSLPKETQDNLEKARGYAVGTIREWSGKKYKKLSSGKWMRTYSGTGERGELQAIRNVMAKIQKASSMEDLSKIVSENMQRFKDDNGKTLPIVKEFMASARGTDSGKKKLVVKKETSWTDGDKSFKLKGQAKNRPKGFMEIEVTDGEDSSSEYIHERDLSDRIKEDKSKIPRREKEKAKKLQEAENKKKRENIDGFADDKNPRDKGMAVKQLNKEVYVPGGKNITVKEMVKDLLKDGWKVQEIDDVERLGSPDGEQYKKVNKTVVEYAKYLESKDTPKKLVVKKESKKDNIVDFPKKPLTNKEIGEKAKLENQQRIAKEFDVPLKKVQELSDKYRKDFPRRKVNIDTVRNLVRESIIKDTGDVQAKLDSAKKEMAELQSKSSSDKPNIDRKKAIDRILKDTGIGATSSETAELYDGLSDKDKKMLNDKYYIRPKTMEKYRGMKKSRLIIRRK